MTANHVLLQILQRVDLRLNGGLVEHLGRLLERSGRDETRGLQCGAGDTLQHLRRGCGNDVAHLNELQVAALEARVLVTQLAQRDNLSRLQRRRVAGIRNHHLVVELVVHIHELPLVDNLVLEEARVSRVDNLHLRHHLTYDDLEVLVVDFHTLHAVDLLHLVDDVLLHTRRAEDVEDVRRSDGTVRKRAAGLHVVVLLHDNLTRQGHQIALHVTLLRGDDDFAVTALDFAEGYLTVNLRHDGGIRRVARLEELRNTRQTTGDVAARLTDCTRNLDEDFARLDFGVVLHHDVGRYREVVLLDLLALLIDNLDDGVLRLVLRLDDHLLRKARLLVTLVAVGHTLDDVLVDGTTVVLRDNHGVVGVPLANHVALLHLGAVRHEERRTVGKVVRIENDVGLRVDDAELRLTRDDDVNRLAGSILALDRTQLVDFQTTLVLRNDVGLDGSTTGHTTDVERTQSQLRTRLADGLCRDDADHLALLYHAGRGQVAAVALGADAVARLAGEHRADFNRLERRLLDCLGNILGNLLAGLAEHLARQGVDDVVKRRTAQNAVVERLYHVVVALDGRSRQTTQRTAVLLVDNHVLSHVDQTARQITGVGRLQGGIGKTLSGTVRRDEVLEHRQTLLEVRENRVLDDLLATLDARLLRLGHQTTHTAQLTNLLLRTTGSRVEHHVDRVETVLVLDQRINHGLRQLGVDVGPDVDNLVVSLVVGNQTHVVVLHDGVGTLVTLGHELLLLLGDDDRVEVERQTALEGHAVTHVLDVVEEVGHLVGTGLLHHHGDDVTQRALGQNLVDVTHLLGNHLVEEDAADGRFLEHAHGVSVLVQVIHHALDHGVQVSAFLVVGDNRLLGTVEDMSLALDALARLGDVVQTEDHVLRRHRDGGAVGRVEDVVRTEHQQLRLQNGGVAQRQVHGHLVTVEVGVEGRTCQRVELHGLALDELGLEGLDTEAVQRRGTVHQHGVTLDDVLEDAPDDGVLAVDYLLGRLHRLDDAALDELADDKRLVELGGHILRDTHLVHLQLGADDDDRTGRVVDTLTEQVLTEAALLALERVGERLERAVRLVLHGVRLARVVEERIDGLLQHALLVAQNHLRGLDFNQALESVVADDDATVEVVQVRRGEAAAVERHQRAQFGRDDRDDAQHHPLGPVLAVRGAERLNHVEALERLGLALLRGLGRGLVAQGVRHRVEVDLLQKRIDGFGTHLGDELVGVAVVKRLVALGQGG